MGEKIILVKCIHYYSLDYFSKIKDYFSKIYSVICIQLLVHFFLISLNMNLSFSLLPLFVCFFTTLLRAGRDMLGEDLLIKVDKHTHLQRHVLGGCLLSLLEKSWVTCGLWHWNYVVKKNKFFVVLFLALLNFTQKHRVKQMQVQINRFWPAHLSDFVFFHHVHGYVADGIQSCF